ncbi:class I adenylate-forming enzyme family protein [Bordetella hinzii]|uniref:class I adenylate-forming enzyme family protein n=1 Tax=Bordetella hinzii TaxID=103855 RepID=UPI001154337D|nr:AMP-binding protein [Bordetella hinzii]QDJ52342.1 hypothetical protein CBR69_19475 [Bordetella hinzii]
MIFTSAVRRAASIRPEGAAIVHGGQRRDWRQTERRIAALAGWLREQGLRPGEHVATLALNAPKYYELLLAVWWVGAVLVPINTRLSQAEIAFILRHAGVRMLVADEHFDAVARQVGGAVRCLSLGEDDYARAIEAPMLAPADTDKEALAGIFYTGGTTGQPKGVALTQLNFAFAALNMQRDLRHDSQTVYLHAPPLFHLADFGIGLGVTLAAGGHSFMDRFSTSLFYERLRDDGVTHLQLAPTMLAMVLDAPERDDALLAGIRSIAYGSAPISQALLRRALAAFPQARIQQFYGMTECCGACAMLPPECHLLADGQPDRLASVGQATSGFELRVVDAQMQVCAPGVAGEIQIKGPAVMRGYWNAPEENRKTLRDGWLCSGDAGYLDDDGYLHVVDRLKDMIISGGENIYCAEVENAIARHPGVAACAVIGVPDALWGEKVHAVVVLREGSEISATEMDAHCRALVGGYKVPRSYDIRQTPLPLSAVGKVQKNVLRAEYLRARGESQ